MAIRWQRHGGCRFAEDPDRSAGDARLFWTEPAGAHVIRIVARPAEGPCRDAVDFAALRLPVFVLPGSAGREQLLLRWHGVHIHLAIVGGTALAGPVVPETLFPDRSRLGARILALRRFDALVRDRRLSAGLCAREQRARRWAHMLQALDGMQAGASQRELAICLFGPTVVATEWRNASDHLRLKVQRLVREAQRMVQGGYRALLDG